MRFSLAAALLLAGCSSNDLLPADPRASLDPIRFFSGRSHGDATLDRLVGGSVRVTVDSVGRTRAGTLVLWQSIRQGDKPPRARQWTMRKVAPNTYSGELTDAYGPVQVTMRGPRAFIRYTMRNGMQVKQQLALQGDQKTVLNRLQVSRFGLRLAKLEETIRKLD